MTRNEQLIKAALDMAAGMIEESAKDAMEAADTSDMGSIVATWLNDEAEAIRAIDPADVLAKVGGDRSEENQQNDQQMLGGTVVICREEITPDAVAQPASSCPPPQHGDETYYSKGKTAEWWVGLTDEQFAWELICASQDLNDTGLGDDLDKWMPHQVMLADAAKRIKRLSTAAADTDAVARLVEAANQARMAFAGYVSAQSAINKLDEALAAMETNHDRT